MTGATFRRALVVRGGALGDFLLTLPVLASLRAAEPSSRVELLAYPGVASLAAAAGLADGTKSIEYGPLAGFFARDATLDPALRSYFASFNLVISYLYDPDSMFADNVRSCGVPTLIEGPHRCTGTSHAIDQLAAPLAKLGLELAGRSARLALTPATLPHPTVALHPGSGSAAKNWGAANWRAVIGELLSVNPDLRVAVIGGEADTATLAALRDLGEDKRVSWWENLPLTELASRLSASLLYLGHDTGVSHLAAVCGTPSLLLYGPTEPGIWAPPHEQVRILSAPAGRLDDLLPRAVLPAVHRLLGPLLASERRPREDASA